MTYNHAPYIEDAMNGFCKQETDFPFICIIIDDASSDGTQEIISLFLQKHFNLEEDSVVRSEETDDYILKFARHKTNLNCFFAVLYLKYNHYSIKKSKSSYFDEWRESVKYIALCEGDDFWTDPYKLQKQVNVLEQHPDCSICFAKVASVTREGKPLRRVYPNKSIPEIFSLEDFIKWEFNEGSWVFHTSSFMCRSVYNIKYIEALRSVFRKFPYGDITIQLFWLEHGNGIYIPDFVSCYRVLSGGYNSYVKKNVGFAIKENERKILGLRDYDNYTNFKYHQIFEKAILTIELDSERRKKNYLAPFSSKYLSLYKKMRTKNLITYLMNYYVPSLLKFLVSIKQTLYK